MVKWKLDKNWFNLVVHVLGLNEVIIATKSGLGYVFLKTLDQLHFCQGNKGLLDKLYA